MRSPRPRKLMMRYATGKKRKIATLRIDSVNYQLLLLLETTAQNDEVNALPSIQTDSIDLH